MGGIFRATACSTARGVTLMATKAQLDPRVLGRRLQEARKARNMTQEAAAAALPLKRPTLVAIEKGDRLEADVGLRIFVFEMASDVAGVFAYNDTLGGCIGINSCHPFPRQRWTLAHEYAHFLSARYIIEITWLADKRRTSPRERLADS